MSLSPFAELGCSPVVAQALSARGIDQAFAIQRLVIPDILAGRDVLAQSPTGSGKTVAFAAPLVDRLKSDSPPCSGLVLAPTRELAQQIVEETRDLALARGLSLCAVYGGAGILRQAKQAARAQILVATPGRLLDLVQRGDVRLDRVRVLVLDEADRMLDMGFRPAVDRILSHTPGSRQTLFFSATLDGEVGCIAVAYTQAPARHEHTPPPSAPLRIEHRFVSVAHDDKVSALVQELDGDRTLVFVRTRHGADRLVKRLRSRAVEAVSMHGAKSQPQRERALARFERGDVATLVATDVVARGIDVDDIAHVINFDAPADRDAYVHRVGRTGRAGRQGRGTTFVLGDQVKDVGRIARELELDRELDAAGLAANRAPRAARRGRARHRPSRS